MTLTIEAQGNPLTAEDLANLEEQLDLTLPAQYRQFLLRSNGGLPSPDVVDVEGLEGGMADIQVFFRIGGSVESSELSWNKNVLSDRLPPRMLPVACDSGGSRFCLSVSGDDCGSVIYVDLQSQELTRYVVAADFDGFLAKIREWVD